LRALRWNRWLGSASLELHDEQHGVVRRQVISIVC